MCALRVSRDFGMHGGAPKGRAGKGGRFLSPRLRGSASYRGLAMASVLPLEPALRVKMVPPSLAALLVSILSPRLRVIYASF